MSDAERFRVVASKLLKIRDKAGNIVPLHLNTSQLLMQSVVAEQIRADTPARVIVWKGRQQGISTGVAAYNFLSLLAEPKSALIITNEQGGSAQNLWDIYLTYENHFPVSVDYERTRLGKMRKYGNGSSLRVEGEKKITSFTHQLIHLSEAPFFSRLSATLEMVLQTVPNAPGTAVFMESAANEFGMESQGDWQTEWERAKEGKSDFYPLFIPWHVHEEYRTRVEDPEAFRKTLGDNDKAEYGNESELMETHALSFEHLLWRRQTIANNCGGSVYRFQRQYPNTPEELMQASGLHIFDLNVLARYKAGASAPVWVGDVELTDTGRVELKPHRNGVISIWHPPEPGAEYVAGSDHAEGLPSGDFNVAYILRRMPIQVCACLRGHDGNRLSLSTFSLRLFALMRYYNEAWWCPESNLDGGTVIALLREKYHYGKIIGEAMLGWSKQTDRLGWRSTSLTRKFVINFLQEMVDSEQIDILDAALIAEMFTMVMKDGKPEAMKKGEPRKPGDPEAGFYDDRPFALGGALIGHRCLPPPQPRRLNLPSERERLEDPDGRKPLMLTDLI